MFAIEPGGPYGNPNYHKSSDTVATLDLPFHADVTRALVATLASLANE
jgi:hypothetical protein